MQQEQNEGGVSTIITENGIFSEPVGDFTPEELMMNSVDTMHATRKMFAIRRIKREIEQLEKQAKESAKFYENKLEKFDKQIEFLEADVWRFLNAEGMDRISTPAGTAYIQKKETWTWIDDRKAIIEWAKKQFPELVTPVSEDKIDLTQLKKKIVESSVVPQEIVTVADESRIVVKTNP